MRGMLTIARLEVLLRFRAGRWRWLLLSWFIGLVLFSWLLSVSISRTSTLNGHRGDVLFGGLQLFMLLLALFIVPALTSQSVNGDRERGRLGVLQVTDVSSLDIIGGKLIAAWGTAGVFVAVSAPITIFALVEGGISVVQVVVVTLVMMLLLGIICAIGLGLSALLARSTTSSVLTYVAVFVLLLGTVILAGLVTAVESVVRRLASPTGTPGISSPPTRSSSWPMLPPPPLCTARATPSPAACRSPAPGSPVRCRSHHRRGARPSARPTCKPVTSWEASVSRSGA